MDPIMNQFPHKHLLSLANFSTEDFETVFETTREIRKMHKDDWPRFPLERKILALLFEKRSTRTRASFYAAMVQLGGSVAEYPENVLHVGEGHETLEDTARVIGMYSDGIVIRCYHQSKIEQYAENARVPVISGLTDDLHPCQILADIFTLEEKFGNLKGFRLAFVGRPNNISNTLIQACATLGIELVLGYPAEFPWAHRRLHDFINAIPADSAGKVTIMHDAKQAVSGAQAVYTDTWFNTGESFKDGEKVDLGNRIREFQVNHELMKHASKGAYFMHCLPAERGNEVTNEVIDHPTYSLVWRQAMNRLHVQKAILALLLS